MLLFENGMFDTVGIVGSSIHCFYWCSRFQQSFQKRASKASCICLSVIVASVLLGKQVLLKEKMGNCLDVSIALKSLWQPWCIEFSPKQSLPLDWFISICEAFVPDREKKISNLFALPFEGIVEIFLESHPFYKVMMPQTFHHLIVLASFELWIRNKVVTKGVIKRSLQTWFHQNGKPDRQFLATIALIGHTDEPRFSQPWIFLRYVMWVNFCQVS